MALLTSKSPVIEVDVTQEHIDAGKPGKYAFCPIALAIKEACDGREFVSVRLTNCQVGHWRYDLPEVAIDFIRQFDFSGTGPAIKFRLEDGKLGTYWL